MMKIGGGPVIAQNGITSAATICVACATHITVRRRWRSPITPAGRPKMTYGKIDSAKISPACVLEPP
jgi:hypothetical protein